MALVVEILGEHRRPMSNLELRAEVQTRMQRAVTKDTMFYVLQRSKAARNGQIVQVSYGRYALAELEASSTALPT
ncbi:MAG: hypothetical protein EOP19_13240 [Hyphomicrobiales bacterium]|nr:MAG: hypothetical protein EOP19_13240 [Hyphomicrobiales bacterium]